MKETRKSTTFYLLTTLAPLLVAFSLSLALGLNQVRANPAYHATIATVCGTALFATAMVIVVEFVAHFFNHEASWNTFIVAAGLLLLVGVSPDSAYLFGIDIATTAPTAIHLMLTISQLGLVLMMLGFFRFFRHDYHIPLEKSEIVVSYLIPLLGLAMFYPLAMAKAEYVVMFIDAILIFYWSIRFFLYVTRAKEDNATFYYSNAIMFAGLGIGIIIAFGHCFSGYFLHIGIPSLLALVAVLLFYAIYLTFVVSKTHDAYKKAEYERQLVSLQSVVFKEQIKPHFVFNVLNAIKIAYRKDLSLGEQAIDLFSKYLRSSTEAASIYLVPLSKELDLISWYVELESLKVPSPYRVIYNIDAFDFEVPYFGLQPLVENAIKHAKLNQEEGYIEISTSEEEDGYHIVISDNGIGFEPSSIAKGSYGMGNVANRFKLLLHASFLIDSTPGKGTSITIVIPKGGHHHESHRR